MTENLIIFNARVVTPVGFSARRGREMEELCIIDDATVEVTGGVITYVGPNRGEERDGYYQRYWHYNARGKCLLPGFVDSHTHFVFGGGTCRGILLAVERRELYVHYGAWRRHCQYSESYA